MNGGMECQDTYLFQFSEWARGQRKRPYLLLMHSCFEVVLCNAVFLIIL